MKSCEVLWAGLHIIIGYLKTVLLTIFEVGFLQSCNKPSTPPPPLPTRLSKLSFDHAHCPYIRKHYTLAYYATLWWTSFPNSTTDQRRAVKTGRGPSRRVVLPGYSQGRATDKAVVFSRAGKLSPLSAQLVRRDKEGEQQSGSVVMMRLAVISPVRADTCYDCFQSQTCGRLLKAVITHDLAGAALVQGQDARIGSVRFEPSLDWTLFTTLKNSVVRCYVKSLPH